MFTELVCKVRCRLRCCSMSPQGLMDAPNMQGERVPAICVAARTPGSLYMGPLLDPHHRQNSTTTTQCRSSHFCCPLLHPTQRHFKGVAVLVLLLGEGSFVRRGILLSFGVLSFTSGIATAAPVELGLRCPYIRSSM